MNPTMQALQARLATVLTPQEKEWLGQHLVEGAPGFQQYIASKRLDKTMRVIIDDYFEFLKKGE